MPRKYQIGTTQAPQQLLYQYTQPVNCVAAWYNTAHITNLKKSMSQMRSASDFFELDHRLLSKVLSILLATLKLSQKGLVEAKWWNYLAVKSI